MLFSTWNREWKKDLHIVMNGTKIPETDNLTLLGVHLDHSLTFGEHANKINAAALKKNNALKLIEPQERAEEKRSYSHLQSNNKIDPKLRSSSLGS